MKKISLASTSRHPSAGLPITRDLIFVLTFVMIFAAIIGSAAAETLYDEDLTEYIDTSHRGIAEQNLSRGITASLPNILVFKDITAHKSLYYVVMEFAGNFEPSMDEGRYDFNYVFNGQTRPGVVYKTVGKDLFGTITVTRLQVFFNEWDIGELTGKQTITLPFITSTVSNRPFLSNTASAYLSCSASDDKGPTGDYNVLSAIDWTNHITVTDDNIARGYYTELNRSVDGLSNPSTINFTKNDAVIFSNADNLTGFLGWFTYDEIDCITVTNPNGRQYVYPLDAGSEPTTQPAVTVYVRNSQTGAAIANSQIVIDALVDGDYYPVVNCTEPSGIFSVTLQPTGGGMPNPDGYRLIASADGYNNPMPEINFTVDEYTSIYCYLDPIAGGPLDENKTFIDFFVRDMSANPISGATVNFGGYTLLTNSQGYTVFEVDINKPYTWAVSKSGYGSLTGNAVIGADDRYTVNAVLGPSVTPTTPTAIPTSTPIGPSPTLTAPTGEPVSNLLEWFAAHFGMVLGGGVEIGKLFMWLCFTVPVGVYVGKEAKAGAAGFMAGAGIVTLFFVLIGWVPIWLVVLLALIIGLLYAKVFNNENGGGGR